LKVDTGRRQHASQTPAHRELSIGKMRDNFDD
jgi:hypothetical protein